MDPMLVPVIGTVVTLGVLPAIVFNFVYKAKKLKADRLEIEAHNETLRLEIERDRTRIALIEASKDK